MKKMNKDSFVNIEMKNQNFKREEKEVVQKNEDIIIYFIDEKDLQEEINKKFK
jgi:hypothetical protein